MTKAAEKAGGTGKVESQELVGSSADSPGREDTGCPKPRTLCGTHRTPADSN